jgi:alginate O-acetyltransferase complex protein AlgI
MTTASRARADPGRAPFSFGLGKKVLIANNVGYLWSLVSSGQAGDPSVLLYWLGIAAYTFQIYFDFSGYSDMAIGVARIFGLTFDENFNYPYISKSITEFWRRWHMTLSSWFRDYVYIPLGGNRCSKLRHIRNILVVWALTGLWHGASWNFVLWGLYFAVWLIMEKYFLMRFLEKAPAAVSHVYTLLLVMISWVIFYFEDISAIRDYLKGMFGFGGVALVNAQAMFYLTNYAAIFLVAAYFSKPHFRRVIELTHASARKSVWVCTTAAYLFILLASVAYLVNGTYNPFLYFRF